MPEEREERLIHRIESFSDIVIGFSLAQLGATLVVPPHPQSLVEHPGWLLAFLWTFSLVCLMWWNHNRIFRTSFRPTPVSMVLNFVLLATIVLIVYFAQVFARVTTQHDGLVAGRLYFGTLAITAIVTALLYYVNHGAPRGMLVNAISGGIQLAVVIASFAIGDNPIGLPAMGIAVPIAFVIGGIVARRVVALPVVPA